MIHDTADSTTDMDALLRAGIEAAESGDHERARDLLGRVVAKDRRNVAAWLWLSEVVDAADGKIHCLERILVVDPGNKEASRRLEQLRGARAGQYVEILPVEAQPDAEIQHVEAQPAVPVQTAPQWRGEFTLITVLGMVLLLFIALGGYSLPGPTFQLLLGLAFALLLAAGSAMAIIGRRRRGEQLTDFTILGSEGLAESYPREVVAGEAVPVTAGIANREGVPAEYRIEVRAGDQQIGALGPIALADGETWEGQVQFAPPQAGDDQQILFLLYRDGGSEPYRTLRLWINVTGE